MDIVGLIPAAGLAKRLGPLPCSKEIFPLGTMERSSEDTIEYSPKPVGLYLIERMAKANVQKAFIIISKEKWDIPRYFGNGTQFNVSMAYLIQENLKGMPFALNQAYPWVQNSTILFGMPDTIFFPDNAFVRLLADHKSSGASLTLGLFPTKTPERFGMVDFDEDMRMTATIDKPKNTNLRFMWGIGCWGPEFSRYMMEWLEYDHSKEQEVVLGNVFQSALKSGLDIRVTPFYDGEYIDIGNLNELTTLVPIFSLKKER